MLKIAVLHNLKPAAPSEADDSFAEYDEPSTIEAICASLRRLGVNPFPVTADRRLPWRLSEGRYDFAFNIAEFEGGRCREAIPAAICELMDLPFTGSDALTLALALDKSMAKRIVASAMPVARGELFEASLDFSALDGLRYPVLVKPNDEGSSKGIRDGSSLCANPAEAASRVREQLEIRGRPMLVEEFLSGPEVTVGIRGNGTGRRVLGAMQIEPRGEDPHFVYSFEAKQDWRRRIRYVVPPRLSEDERREIERQALTAYRLLGCRDIARVDFRLDANRIPHFIECNPLPGLEPGSSDMVLLSRNHCSYDELVQGLFLDALARYNVSL